jgi:rod shape-determining protein MreC
MHWIIEFVIRHRNFCSLLLTVMISLWMISSPEQQRTATARLLTVTVFYPLQVSLNQIKTISDIFKENRHLRLEVVTLATQVAALKEQAVENDRLRGMLNISKDFNYDLTPVRVIARDPSESFRSIIINGGKKDGIKQWMPVVGEFGVVGKVVQVMGSLSLVQILRDPINRTSVMAQRTRTVGILESPDGQSFFLRCRSHEDVKIGDTVITSGLGGIYPRGLRVGFISKISDSGDPLFKKAWIKLSVDFDHVEELFVMRLSPQWSSFVNEFDSLEYKQ